MNVVVLGASVLFVARVLLPYSARPPPSHFVLRRVPPLIFWRLLRAKHRVKKVVKRVPLPVVPYPPLFRFDVVVPNPHQVQLLTKVYALVLQQIRPLLRVVLFVAWVVAVAF